MNYTKERNEKISKALKGRKHTIEERKKMSESHKGKKLPLETCLKISNSNKGKVKNELWKKHLSDSLKGKNKGKKRSEEFKKKVSLSLKGRKFSKEHLEKLKASHQKLLLNPEYCRRWKESLKKRPPPSIEWKENRSKQMKGEKNFMYGKHHSEETKRKIKETNKKTWSNPDLRNKQKQCGWKTNKILSEKKGDTSIENIIKNYLTKLQIGFKSQILINDIEHSFLCDIYIPDKNLVIECDGNYWHNYPNRNSIDKIRTKEMILRGYKVLRLWESDIVKMNLQEFSERYVNIITNWRI